MEVNFELLPEGGAKLVILGSAEDVAKIQMWVIQNAGELMKGFNTAVKERD